MLAASRKREKRRAEAHEQRQPNCRSHNRGDPSYSSPVSSLRKIIIPSTIRAPHPQPQLC